MEEAVSSNKKRFIKPLVFILGVLILVLVGYLIVSPFYPAIKYKFFQKNTSAADYQDLSKVVVQTEAFLGQQKAEGQSDFTNRLVITKIGVNAPIVEGKNESALNRGAWRWPGSGTPDIGGNTIITGHRFKYLPPNNLTFYLFDKLVIGDIISVFWQGNEYYYRIFEVKRVSADDLSILASADKPILTLFTCDPIWSQANRLVVIGEPVTY